MTDRKDRETPGYAGQDARDALTLPSEGPRCRACGGRGWHTAGGNDPAACGACSAGAAWYGEVESEIARLDESGVAVPMGGFRNRAIKHVANRHGLNPYALDRIIREAGP